MAAKALVQFLLFAQVLANGSNGGGSKISSPVGSVSASPSGKPSLTPSIATSLPRSVSPTTKKTGSATASTPKSVKRSLSPSSIPPSKFTTVCTPSSIPSQPVSSIPVSKSPSASPSGGSSVTKPNTSASGSVQSTAKPSSPGSQSSSSGTGPKPSGSSGNGSQPPNPKTTGSPVSDTNGGSATTGPVTKPNGSGQSSPTTVKSPNSMGGQSSKSDTNGSPGSGPTKSAGSTGGAIGGSSSSSTASPTSGGNGGGVCPTTCPSCPPTTALGPTATLGCGIVTGTTTSLYAATATVNKFLGVPFAQSPPRRFSPPQKGGSCNIEAKAFKPACIQQFVYPKLVQDFAKYVFNNPGGAPPEESEDCLYLNVYAPSSPAPAGGRAVMFWIYGGALQFGTAGIPYYDGSYLAGYEDVIVVTTNYRTNVFGFATSPEIPISERNLGFLDQRAALDWVQQNIAAFGGSPDKVTIFGESAGGFSVDALLTSFPANSTPPFRGAIMESGQISYNAQSRPSTVPQWNQLAKLLNCPGNYTSNLACLRAANASSIKDTIEQNILTFNPVGDGITLASNPLQKRLDGNIAQIPILAGTNAQEGRVFALGQSNTTAFLSTLLGNDTATIQALEAAYPLNSTGIGATDYDQSAQIFTELIFQCSAAYHANATASIGIPAWRYYYNASFFNSEPYPGLGVFHASEIPLVFSTYSKTNVTVQQYALSRTMRSIWASFAKNPWAGPGWNPVGSGIEASVLSGATGLVEGGILMFENGTLARGSYDLGVLGNRGDVPGSGVTIIDPSEVDYRCGLYESTYQKNAKIG